MARPLRIDIAGGWYHVISRGIERRDLYVDARDREHFLELLEAMVDAYRIRIHSYVLMPNHFHLIVETPDANLSQAMQWLKTSYSAWFNAKHDRVGPLFQGRFKSVPVENSAWAYELSLYVHLNPVMMTSYGLGKRSKKAESRGWRKPSEEESKSRLEKLRGYRWSSYPCYAGYRKTPVWLTTSILLERAARDEKARRQAYRDAVKQRITKGLPEEFEEKLKERFVLGAESFRKKIQELAEGGRDIADKAKLRKKLSFDDMVGLVEKVRGESFSDFMARRGDWGRPLLIWGARRYCSISLRELGELMGGVDYAALSVMLKRFERQAALDKNLTAQMAELKRNVEC